MAKILGLTFLYLFIISLNMSTICGRSSLNNFRDYSKFKVYRLNTNSSESIKAIRELSEEGSMDFWQLPKLGGYTDVMVDESQEVTLLKLINDNRLDYSVIIDNVDKLISDFPMEKKWNRGGDNDFNLRMDKYHYPEAIMFWMEGLSKLYPKLCKVYTIGQSIEQNPLKLMRISTGLSPSKRAVFIDATTHGREWITTAVATYIINDLVRNSTKHSDLLKSFDFYILPIVNPDGYLHSCFHDRLWRKSTRSSAYSIVDLVGCRGVDLNRNYGYEWGGAGSSSLICSPSYRGTAPFSEPETSAIKKFVKGRKEVNWTAYFSLHSYGQKWLTPWGYTDEKPDDYDEMIRVATIGAKALRSVYGTNFTVGSAAEVLYLAAGASDDWFKGEIGVPYSYTLELRDTGSNGFVLPPSQIIPTSEETWDGIMAALQAIPLGTGTSPNKLPSTK